MLPIGHQLHHLSLEGHVSSIHAGEVAGLALNSPWALKESATGVWLWAGAQEGLAWGPTSPTFTGSAGGLTGTEG